MAYFLEFSHVWKSQEFWGKLFLNPEYQLVRDGLVSMQIWEEINIFLRRRLLKVERNCTDLVEAIRPAYKRNLRFKEAFFLIHLRLFEPESYWV